MSRADNDGKRPPTTKPANRPNRRRGGQQPAGATQPPSPVVTPSEVANRKRQPAAAAKASTVARATAPRSGRGRSRSKPVDVQPPASAEAARSTTQPARTARTARRRANAPADGSPPVPPVAEAVPADAVTGAGAAPHAPTPPGPVLPPSIPDENTNSDRSMPQSVKTQLVLTLIDKARRIVMASCIAFIAGFVCIDEPDDPTPKRFRLWPAQVEVLKTFLTGQKAIVLKARQLGLTWLAISYAVWKMMTRPGYRVVCLSKGDDEAKELIRRATFILDNLPRWLVWNKKAGMPPEGVVVYSGSTEALYLIHPGGRVSSILSFPASKDAGRSFTASLVIIDEWAFQLFAREIWTAAYPTINRPNSGQVIGLSTGARGTLFEEMWRDARNGENVFTPIFLPWWSDPSRTKEWYEATKKAMKTSYRREYPANEEDAFSAGQGAAFQEWDDRVHIYGEADWYPQGDHWRIFIAYDPGYSTHAACYWIALHSDGWAVCYREYYVTKVIDPIQAEDIREMSKQPAMIGGKSNPDAGKPERITAFFIPTDAWLKKSDTGKCTADIFTEHGHVLTKATNDRLNGWRRMHEWLKPFEGEDGNLMAKLRFTRACKAAIRHFPAATMHKNDPEDVDYDEDHVLDAVRYFVASNARPAPDKRRRTEDAPAPNSKITGY